MKNIIHEFYQETVCVIALFTIIFLTVSCEISDPQSVEYRNTLYKTRAEKDSLLAHMEKTPLTEEQLKEFGGLLYYAPDSRFRISGVVKKNAAGKIVRMKTSTDRAPEYIIYGNVSFNFEGKVYELTAFQNKEQVESGADTSHLFIPFRDKTSGKETYGGGRYIDSEVPARGDSIVIDFNLAYNPYCAYNHKYSCVIPPPENYIETEIEAGEKNFTDH